MTPNKNVQELPKYLTISFSMFPLRLENTQKAATCKIQNTDVKYAYIWQHVLLFFLFPNQLFQNYPAGSLQFSPSLGQLLVY